MTTPILTGHLFRPLAGELLTLLRSLAHIDWTRPTSAGTWQVRDVVAHLIDGSLRRVSAERDQHAAPPPATPIRGYADVVAFLDELNAQWVTAAARLSPAVLVELLELASERLATVMETADPHAPALFEVAWAGVHGSTRWLDHGRDFTEQWHHQDQIREAVGAPPLRESQWLRPVLSISLLALPRGYAQTAAEPGTSIVLDVSGPAGGAWTLERTATTWALHAGASSQPATRVRIEDYDLARLLLHRLSPDSARVVIDVTGDAALAQPLLATRAVMV